MAGAVESELMYRLLLAVDIEKYSARVAVDQLLAQADLRQVLDTASKRAGLDRSQWHQQVSGDGELAVLPADVDVPRAVGGFVQHLDVALAELNSERTPSLRVRLAMHHGTLASGPFGPVGDAPVVVSRLLDCGSLRRLLARTDGDLALAVSDSLYRDVIRTGFCSLDPARFQSIRVVAKGVAYRGYLYETPERTAQDKDPVPPIEIRDLDRLWSSGLSVRTSADAYR
jgi:hypothetical protein